MRSKRVMAAAASVAAAVTVCVLAAQQAPPAAAPSPDEAAVRAAATEFARAFEKGDAKAFAALWTETGEYVDEDGPPVRGREAIEKGYADFFAKRKEVAVEGKTDAVRMLGKDTAIEEGTFTVKAKDAPASTSRYSALFVRQDGKWLVALLKEWQDGPSARADLQDLAWLVGTWQADGPEHSARTTYSWAENKKFLLSRYAVTNKKDNTTAAGTQVIGVDPATGLVRSWTFDAGGGIGEADWVWDGERWVIESAGTLADGTATTATNFLTRSGADAFTWRSVQRTAGGEAQPDIPAVKVSRVAEGK